MAFGQLSVKGRALKLLAGRDHSRRELERKLEGDGKYTLLATHEL